MIKHFTESSNRKQARQLKVVRPHYSAQKTTARPEEKRDEIVNNRWCHSKQPCALNPFRFYQYLHELIQIFEKFLLIYGKFIVFVNDVIMFHFSLGANAQRVISWVVVALSHKKEPVFSRL